MIKIVYNILTKGINCNSNADLNFITDSAIFAR